MRKFWADVNLNEGIYDEPPNEERDYDVDHDRNDYWKANSDESKQKILSATMDDMFPSGLLHGVKFASVIVDEGHCLKNPYSRYNSIIRVLPKESLFIVTATLLLNQPADIRGCLSLFGDMAGVNVTPADAVKLRDEYPKLAENIYDDSRVDVQALQQAFPHWDVRGNKFQLSVHLFNIIVGEDNLNAAVCSTIVRPLLERFQFGRHMHTPLHIPAYTRADGTEQPAAIVYPGDALPPMTIHYHRVEHPVSAIGRDNEEAMEKMSREAQKRLVYKDKAMAAAAEKVDNRGAVIAKRIYKMNPGTHRLGHIGTFVTPLAKQLISELRAGRKDARPSGAVIEFMQNRMTTTYSDPISQPELESSQAAKAKNRKVLLGTSWCSTQVGDDMDAGFRLLRNTIEPMSMVERVTDPVDRMRFLANSSPQLSCLVAHCLRDKAAGRRFLVMGETPFICS